MTAQHGGIKPPCLNLRQLPATPQHHRFPMEKALWHIRNDYITVHFLNFHCVFLTAIQVLLFKALRDNLCIFKIQYQTLFSIESNLSNNIGLSVELKILTTVCTTLTGFPKWVSSPYHFSSYCLSFINSWNLFFHKMINHSPEDTF